MQNIKINLVYGGKAFNADYCTGAFHTNSPKFFLKYFKINEPFEYGICTRDLEDDGEYKYHPMDCDTSLLVKKYKKVLEVVDLTEVEQIKLKKDILSILKEDIFEFNKGTALAFGLIWLFSGNHNLGYGAYIAALYVICSTDIFEAYRLVRASLTSEEKKERLDSELGELGLSDVVQNVDSRNDINLYFKVQGDFKLKK